MQAHEDHHLPLPSRRISLLIAAGVLFYGVSAAGEGESLEARLIRQAVESISNGKRPRVYVDVAGAPTAARVIRADGESLWLGLHGSELPLRWRTLSPARLCGILRKVLPADDAPTRLALAEWAAAKGLKKKAEDELARALELDSSLSERVAQIRAILKPKPPARRPAAPKQGAERMSTRTAPGPSAPLGAIRVRKPIRVADAPDLARLNPHPRLWITGKKLFPTVASVAELRARGGAPKSGPAATALSYLITGNARALAESKTYLSQRRGGGNPYVVMEQALVYDWVHGGLSPKERKSLGAILVDSAYASGKRWQGKYVGLLDNNTYRWALPFALAALTTAGEDPRADELFQKVWPSIHGFLSHTGDDVEDPSKEKGYALHGGGWAEGYDYDRHGSRFMLPILHGLRSAGAVDAISGSRFVHDKIYYQIYGMLPDRKHHVAIEDDDHQQILYHDRQIVLMCAGEFPGSHAGTYLRIHPERYGDLTRVMEFVFTPRKLKELPLESLPTARHFQGIGLVTMRSDWSENATFVSLQAGDHFVYHENNAENAFTIYRRAPLAVDAGVYDGSVHDQYVNYSIRSIAHNTVLVYDPGEKFKAARKAANDGGQKILNWNGWVFIINRDEWLKKKASFADKAEMLDFRTNRQYDYAAGEAGRSYAKGKVTFFSRQVVLVKPDWVVVFDRVTSGNPSHQKTWLCHVQDEVQDLGGGRFVATTKGGPKVIGGPMKMHVHSLLPRPGKGVSYEIIGGPGKEYFYAGRNWAGRSPYNGQPGGQYRIEVRAPKTKTTYFLHAMFVPLKPGTPSPKAEIDEETGSRVVVSLAGGKYKLVFNKQGPVKFEMLRR